MRARVALVLLVLGLLVSSCVWPQFRFGASRSGFNPFQSGLGPKNVADLEVVWTASSGAAFASYGSPVIAEGNVYASVVGDPDELFAYAAGTGARRWSTNFAPGGVSDPATVDGRTYVVSRGSLPGKLFSFDAQTGARQEVPSQFPQIPAGTPAVTGGNAFVGYLARETEPPFQVFTGLVVFGPSAFAVSGDGIAVPTVAVAEGVVYTAEGTKLRAYDAEGTLGQLLWSATTAQATTATPAVSGGVVYLGTDDGKLYAFDAAGCGAATCEPLWTAATAGPVRSSAAVADGKVYVGSDDGKLYAFDAAGCGAATCEPLWTAATAGPVRSSPAVADNLVFVGSDDGNIYAFAAAGCKKKATCTALWQFTTGVPVRSSPAVANGMVVVGAGNTLYAFA